jgi:hypothetical protein
MDKKNLIKGLIKKGREIKEKVRKVNWNKKIKWWKKYEKEKKKCEWMRKEEIIKGVVNELKCVKGKSNLDWFKKIKMKEDEIVGKKYNIGKIEKKLLKMKNVE